MTSLKHMSDALILEIEQRVMTLTHAQVGRGSFHLVDCKQVEIRGLRAGDVSEGAEKLFSTLACPDRHVHVVLGDRRFIHHKLETPRLNSDALAAFVRRELHRESKLDSGSQILSTCRILATKRHNRLACGVVALPADVWQPVHAGLARAGVTVASLSSVEDAATAICDQGQAKHLAILDLAGRGARLIQAEDGVVVRVRRFPLPGVDVEEEASVDLPSTVAHLAVEIRRTLDHFKSAGIAPPDLLVLSHHVEGGAELIERVTGEVPFTEWFALESNLCERGITPGLASLGTIRRLANGNLKDLLSTARIEVPTSKLRTAITLGAAVVTIVLGTASAWIDHRVTNLAYESRLLSGQAGILERSGSEDRALRRAEIASREKLNRVLRRRRPFSLAIAAICNAVPEEMSLDELTCNGRGEIVIEGTVRDPSSLRALELIAEFSEQLRTLPYLKRPVETVDEGDGDEPIRFRVSAQWRQS